MKTVQGSTFKLNPIAASIVLALVTQWPATVQAGSGWGSGVDASNTPVAIPTYYANSAVGPVPYLDTTGQLVIDPVSNLPQMTDTGKALRKFVDTLPGIGAGSANNLGQYIPVAVPEKWVDLRGNVTQDDYYEIAAIEYAEKMHSDLPNATHLRGYVQISTAANPGKHIALTYLSGLPVKDGAGKQVYVVDLPHHLGPIINASKGTAVRIKFTNYLPVGGELFIPVDTTVTGAGVDANTGLNYSQNRANVHLYGGDAPWISGGSPHQWVAPNGENPKEAKGVATQNVPDMPIPGAGSYTLYFPNQVSARFTFIQDRTSGLTRLNTYAGLEAGYVITDDTEKSLIGTAVPADQIPLIIEDKTFIPKNIGQQDRKWDSSHWGGEGDLWFPHVYETNQDPNSLDGSNPVGRWDWGPWFWPIFAASSPLPTGDYGDASFVPEAYMDTPLINGTAYPTLSVDPKAYRFRILNASTDRFYNMGLYLADPAVQAPQLDANGNPIFDANGNQQYFTNTEVRMVDAKADVNGNPVGWDAENGVQLPLPQYPNLATIQNIGFSGPTQAWPVDGRVGGAPDPAMAGPDIIQIGNEGGLLPHAVDIPVQPVTYESNRRSITVTNIYGYDLLMGPGERADTIIDFSKYAGQTLILYNDGPAPTPFNDTRDDYYTGDMDQTGTGGAYSTKPGYGPNTRTMMQIKVNAVTPAEPFDTVKLDAALTAAYGASQDRPLVPESAYNGAFGTQDADTFGRVSTGSEASPSMSLVTGANGVLTLDRIDVTSSSGAANLTSGMGYDPLTPPIVNIVGGGGTGALAHAVVDASTHGVAQVILDNPGINYLSVPTVTFSNPEGTHGIGAQATVHTTNTQTIMVQTKAEQELFDSRGRYNSTLGVELPFVNATTQTTIPLNYIDTPTETINDGETQIWKIVDNGLWSNTEHFDFLEVQLINRVGWDGTVKQIASNEVGWKDTLQQNPLEDVIVAVRAKRPQTPFGVPQSSRLMDPSVKIGAAGSGMGFTVDAGVVTTIATGGTSVNTPLIPVGTALLSSAVNRTANYDNEYLWSSGSLSHAEDDYTRPVVFHPNVSKPDAASNLSGAGNTIHWTDPTPPGGVDAAGVATLGNPKNEIGYNIQRATYAVVASGVNAGQYLPGAYTSIGNVAANATGYTDLSIKANTDYAYRVSGYNVAGSTPSAETSLFFAPATPTGLRAAIAGATGVVTLSWNASIGATGYIVTINGTALPVIPAGVGTSVSDVPNLALGGIYSIQVAAQKINTSVTPAVTGTSANSAAVTADLSAPAAPGMPTGLSTTITAATGAIRVNWTAVAGAAGYAVYVDGSATPVMVTTNSYTPSPALAVGSVHSFQVAAVASKFGTFPVSGLTAASGLAGPVTADLTIATPADPTVLNATLSSATRVALSWMDMASNETAYVVEVSTNGGAYSVLTTIARSGAQGLSTGTAVTYNATVAAGNTYSYRVMAQTVKYGVTVSSGYATATPAVVSVTAPLAATGVSAVSVANAPVTTTAGVVTVSWTLPVPATNLTGMTVQRRTVTGGVAGAWSGNICSVAATVTNCAVTTGLTKGNTYQFQVTTTGVVGNTVSVPSVAILAK